MKNKFDGSWQLWQAVIRKRILLLLRYWFNTAAHMTAMYIVFLVLFFGGKSVGGANFDQSLGGLIVGYFVWILCTNAYQTLIVDIRDEAQWGTLEQMFMSPFQFSHVMIAKMVSGLIVSFLWGTIFLLLMMVTTGRWVNLDLVSILPVILVMLLPVLGIGMAMGGLTLLYKRMANTFGIVQFLMVGLISAPSFSDHFAIKLLPIAHGTQLLHQIMNYGVPLLSFGTAELLFFFSKNTLYFLVGFYLFRLLQKRARKIGVLGHY